MPPSSQTVVSLLRGINVGGRNKVAMSKLTELFELLGFNDVRSYLQSGNVLCSTSKLSNAALQRRIEKGIVEELDLEISVLCRTGREMELVVKNNPFLKKNDVDPAKLHVTFLQKPVDEALVKKLSESRRGKDSFRAEGATIYLHCPDGYARTKLTTQFFERELGVPATTRNWKTVNKLHDMSQAN